MEQFSGAGVSCEGCRSSLNSLFSLSMAFQPIVDTVENTIFAYEALVRGTKNEPASSLLSQLTKQNLYAFDQACRVKAISLAVDLGLHLKGAKLSINFLPGAVYRAASCIKLTLDTAQRLRFPLDQLIFEVVESEEVTNRPHLSEIFREYHRQGFQVALDDFGSGYSNLNLLADLAPDLIKLDMDLIRGIDHRPAALAIVEAVVALCGKLGVKVVAEGVETVQEYESLRDCGLRLMQGYLFARPAFELLPTFSCPDRRLI